MLSAKYKDLTVGIFMAAIAVLYLAGTTTIATSQVVSIGAEFMPRIYGGCLLVVSVFQIIRGISAMKKYAGGEGAGGQEKSDMLNVLKAAATIVVYVAAMQYIGFIIASVLLIFILCTLLTPGTVKKNYIAYSLFAVIISVAVFVLFKNYMNLNLPIGVFFGG